MRLHIEELILSCYLNQNRTNELDQMEFKDYKIPFELFKANKTNKLCAKAILNLQEENKPIDDVIVLEYVQSRTKIIESEWLNLLSKDWCTFDTFLQYVKMLKDIDNEEKISNKLKAMR